MQPLPFIEFALRTDAGRDPEKQVNEDTGVCQETALGWLGVVCDGMGGHAGGKEASHAAVEAMVREIAAAPAHANPQAVLRDAVVVANQRVRQLGDARGRGRPGSTVVAALVHAGGADLAHVGDSRIYWVHGASISAVTRDHSAVRAMVDAGVLSEEQAKHHPEANKITRALGVHEHVEVEVAAVPIAYASGDYLLLCSDGLSDLVEPMEMLGILTSSPVAQAAGKLIDLANARGGHDNITALVIRFQSAALSAKRDADIEVRAAAGATESHPQLAPKFVQLGAPDARADHAADYSGDSRRGATQLLGPAVAPGVVPAAPRESGLPGNARPAATYPMAPLPVTQPSAQAAALAAGSGRLPPGATQVDGPVTQPSRALAPPAVAMGVSYPHAHASHAPPMSAEEPASAPESVRAFPLVRVLLGLAVVAILAVLGLLLYRELAERDGKHRTAADPLSGLTTSARSASVAEATAAALASGSVIQLPNSMQSAPILPSASAPNAPASAPAGAAASGPLAVRAGAVPAAVSALAPVATAAVRLVPPALGLPPLASVRSNAP